MAQQLLQSPLSKNLSKYKRKLTQAVEQYYDVPLTDSLGTNQVSSISQIIRTYGKQFKQVRKQYTDGAGGRCVMGVIMSYYGWDGKCISNAERRLYAAMTALRQAGITKELLVELNDSGATFDEIADYLDRNYPSANSNN